MPETDTDGAEEARLPEDGEDGSGWAPFAAEAEQAEEFRREENREAAQGSVMSLFMEAGEGMQEAEPEPGPESDSEPEPEHGYGQEAEPVAEPDDGEETEQPEENQEEAGAAEDPDSGNSAEDDGWDGWEEYIQDEETESQGGGQEESTPEGTDGDPGDDSWEEDFGEEPWGEQEKDSGNAADGTGGEEEYSPDGAQDVQTEGADGSEGNRFTQEEMELMRRFLDKARDAEAGTAAAPAREAEAQPEGADESWAPKGSALANLIREMHIREGIRNAQAAPESGTRQTDAGGAENMFTSGSEVFRRGADGTEGAPSGKDVNDAAVVLLKALAASGWKPETAEAAEIIGSLSGKGTEEGEETGAAEADAGELF